MNNGIKILLTGVAAAAIVAIAMWAVDVDITGDVELPEVVANVDVRGGEMPDVDIETVEVDLEERTATIEVPTDVNVKTEEKSFGYPVLDVTPPEENTFAEESDLSDDNNS